MDNWDKNNIKKMARNYAKNFKTDGLSKDEIEDCKIEAMQQIANAYHISVIDVVSVFNDGYFEYKNK